MRWHRTTTPQRLRQWWHVPASAQPAALIFTVHMFSARRRRRRRSKTTAKRSSSLVRSAAFLFFPRWMFSFKHACLAAVRPVMALVRALPCLHRRIDHHRRARTTAALGPAWTARRGEGWAGLARWSARARLDGYATPPGLGCWRRSLGSWCRWQKHGRRRYRQPCTDGGLKLMMLMLTGVTVRTLNLQLQGCLFDSGLLVGSLSSG